MKPARKNIVITTNLGGISGTILEYDFEDKVVRQFSARGYKEQRLNNVGFRASSDITQTYSSAQAMELLDAVNTGNCYEKVVKANGGIQRIYEANVPSPFLNVD